ncbi:MAG: YfhO family protein [Saprospiraceae bacterium]|nr:YfhO family protein [Saprospiraceae bacterium]
MLIKKLLPHLLAFGVFLVLSCVYFWPQLEGKVVQQGDIIQYMGMSQEAREFEKKTGEKTLWTNAMFGGMPTYQINTVSAGNNLKLLDRVARLDIAPPIGRFVIGMVGFYVLMILLGVNPWLGVIGAVAFGFSTNNFILFEAGHETKLKVISYFPLLVSGMLLAFRKQYLWGGLLFAIGLGLNLWANHVQMTYYLFLTLVFFGVAQLIHDLRQGEGLHFLKAVGVLAVGGLLALGSAASNLWITYEYSKDTMRGEPVLQNHAVTSSDKAAGNSKGLDWDYAMQWSNGTIDVFASFIPGVAGGGSNEPLGTNSAIYKALREKGYRVPDGFGAPLYWGDLPFTSGPIYFGAVIVFLFLFGAIAVNGPVKWWLVLGTLLTAILSMGKNAEAFNTLVFNYVPLYSKFRTPNSILSVTSFLVPLLGFIALGKLMAGQLDKKKALQALYISGGIAGATALFFVLMGPSFFDFVGLSDDRYAETFTADAMRADRQTLMTSDALRAFALVALSAGLIWAFLQKKAAQTWVLAGLGLLIIFDLWTVGRRYLNGDNFTTKNNYEANFRPRPADEQILQDKDLSFRVFDMSENNPFQSTKASYFHKSLGGYHAAKLQRYQDIIDSALVQGNQKVFDMLNTRYVIAPGGEGEDARVQRSPGALGNAWFVSETRLVNSPEEELDSLNTFNPGETAIIHKEFSDYVNGLTLNKAGSIRLSDYKPNALTYQSESSSEQLAVFSEVWYGPNKGWQAYIDGKPVAHIRANYLLRAMRIPAGSHTIEFKFDPQAFKTGKAVSFASSLLLLLALFGWGGWQGWQYSRKIAAEEMAKPVAAKRETPSAAKPKPRKKR